MNTRKKRAPGAGRKPLNPDGTRAKSIEVTLPDADLAYLDQRDEPTRSAAIRACIQLARNRR